MDSGGCYFNDLILDNGDLSMQNVADRLNVNGNAWMGGVGVFGDMNESILTVNGDFFCPVSGAGTRGTYIEDGTLVGNAPVLQ